MEINLILKRGKKDANYIPLEGEPVYTIDTKELLIGDGINTVTNLKAVSILNNIVYDEDGKLYQIKIENDNKEEDTKKVILTPLKMENKIKECFFYIKNKN